MNVELELKTSINTNTFAQGINKFGENADNLINTGIERNGGITNIYETETLYAETGQYVITEDAKTISLVDSGTPDYKIVKIDGKVVGQCSAYGVEKQIRVVGADDIFITTTGYVTCSIVDNIITIREYDWTETLLNSRTVTFTNLGTVLRFFTSLSFVRYNGMVYADSMEWALRLGPQVVILQESNPTITVSIALQSTSVLGTNKINASCVYNNTLILAGVGGRVGSFDGQNWRNYDGSGTGLGIYNDGNVTTGVIGSNDITAICAYSYNSVNYLVIGGNGGRVGSFDGLNWNIWSGATAIANNATVVSTDNITAIIQYSNSLIVAGSVGKLGSWSGTAWVLYSSATGGAICDNATLIGAVSINSLLVWYDKTGGSTLVVSGASGRVGSMKISALTTPVKTITGISVTIRDRIPIDGGFVSVSSSSAFKTTDFVSYTQYALPTSDINTRIALVNGMYFYCILNTDKAYSSPDLSTWTPVSTGGNKIKAIGKSYDRLVFYATDSTGVNNLTGYTTDGINLAFVAHPRAYTGLVITFGYGIGFLFTTPAANTNTGYFTTDGVNFSTSTFSSSDFWYAPVYINGTFVMICANSSATNKSTYSTNGTSWTAVTLPSSALYFNTENINGVLFLKTFGLVEYCSLTKGATWVATVTTPNPSGYMAGTKIITTNQGTSYVELAGYATKAIYTATTQADLPTNNNTVTASDIKASCVYKRGIAFAGASGRVGYYNGAWYNYNTTTASIPTNNGVAIGTNQINSVSGFGNFLVVGGVGGRLASYDGTNWKNYDATGTGTGPYSNAVIIGANDITTMTPYGTILAVSGGNSTVNTLSATGGYSPFYTSGGTTVTNLLDGFNSVGYLYVYRYENGLYLVNLVGNTIGKSYTLNDATKAIEIIKCRYAIPQVSNGVTRHIVSTSDTPTLHIYDATNILCAGLVGYTDFTTYSGTVVYPVAKYTLGNGYVLQSQAGFGYNDFTFRNNVSATNVFNYVSQFTASMPGLYQVIQSNSDTLINAYGKITNNLALPPSVPFEIRVGLINGVQSYLSCALLDGIQQDTLGVLITNVGDFSDSYQPMTINDSTILYQANGSFIITRMGENIAEYIQKIDTGIYKINSISPLNIIDTNTETLELGSMDYNNRMLFQSTAAPSSPASKFASFIQGRYSNSIDTGDKLVTIGSPTASNVSIVGYRVPVVSTSTQSYAVDTYFDDIYAFSTINDGSELVSPDKENTVYVSSTVIPLAIGVTYNNGTATLFNSTTFLKPMYDGSVIGNDIQGTYTTFLLFGQLYLFDGLKIYLANVDQVTGVFNSKTALCLATGLQYIASSPTEIAFLSTFDNSIYIFNGGRNLVKSKRFNSMPDIINGEYDILDNSLCLNTTTAFIYIRDSLATLNDKKASQSTVKLYSTTSGLIIGNNTGKWQYTYNKLGVSSTVVPLDLQTGYYGTEDGQKSILQSFVVTIYSDTRERATVNLTNYTVDADNDYEQNQYFNVKPEDYNSGGYLRLRLIPKNKRCLGSSLRVKTNNKVLIVSLLAEIDNGEKAVVAKERTV